MRYCSGCGVPLQSTDPEQVGFIPSSSMEKENVLCKRCFRIRHYGEIQAVQQTESDFKSILKDLKKKRGLIVYVLDLFDLEGSLIPNSLDILQDKPVFIVGNKVDLFPRSVKRGNIEKYLRSFILQMKIRPVGVAVCSAEKGEDFENVVNAIEKAREGRDVYVIGTTNVGKSTFINRIIPFLGEGKDQSITTSPYPGTTLDSIRIPLQDGKEVVDTPGFLRQGRLSQWLSPEEFKAVTPKGSINPKVFQLDPHQTLFLGGLARIDFMDGEKQSFSVYGSNELYIHRTKRENAEAIFESQRGNLLVPPNDPTVISSWKKQVFHFPGDKKEDIVLSGIGWISCGKGRATVCVWVPEGVYIDRRPALI